MRVSFQNSKVNVIRSFDYLGYRVRLIERKLNQNPIYFLTCDGYVLNMGKKRNVQRKLRELCPDAPYMTASAS